MPVELLASCFIYSAEDIKRICTGICFFGRDVAFVNIIFVVRFLVVVRFIVVNCIVIIGVIIGVVDVNRSATC